MIDITPDFQTNVVRAILQDHSMLKKHRPIIHPSIFKNSIENEVVLHTLKFFDTYNSTPSKLSIINMMCKAGYDQGDVTESIQYLYETVEDIDYIVDTVKDFVTKIKIKDALLESVKLLDKEDYNGIYGKIKEAVSSFEDTNDLGDSFWETTKNVLDYIDRTEDFIPTGLHEVDEILEGGAIRGTLNVILTPPNKGKTTTLVNIGKYAALKGFNVVHYTLELSSMIVRRRYFMSMVGMSKKEMRERKRTAYDKILQLSKNVVDKSIIVKRYTSSKCSTNQIRSHIDGIRNKYGFIPDLMIWDYADLFKPSREYDQKRFELSEIYKELRDIAVDYNAVGWTASQTNRSGDKEELITNSDLAEDFNKAAIADVVISLNQTLEEKRSRPQTARMFFAKNRDNESLVTREVKTDWTRAFVGNL